MQLKGTRFLRDYPAEFTKINVLGFDLARPETERISLKESLNHNDTVYHDACSSKYNQQKLDCAPENFTEHNELGWIK